MSDRRPRTPGVVYSTISVVLMVLVATVALKQTQPPPPSIAEFAPQAVERIEEAPSEQSSRAGSAAGGRGGGGSEGVGSGSQSLRVPDPIDVPRVRRCVGEPPRQIEDPQSPPCVPYWQGDNGGSTSNGVTGTEVRVAYPRNASADRVVIDLMVQFFNRRFEFYGRKIVLEEFTPRGGNGGAPDTAAMRADALEVSASIDPFASLSYPDRHGAEYHYYDALGEQKIVGVAGRPTQKGSAHFTRGSPYQWNYLPSIDKIQRNYAEFVCGSLAHRDADRAGPQLRENTRVFGLIRHRSADGSTPDMSALRNGLKRCGVEIAKEVEDSGDLNSLQTAMVDMQSEDVTSIIPFQHGSPMTQYMITASSMGYRPEWVIPGYLYQDYDFNGRIAPEDQRAGLFGLTWWNKSLPAEDMPWMWAVKETDPDNGGGGYTVHYEIYVQLLLLASGIQMAGPDLSAATFERGLFNTRFPNPGCGGPPMYQACVGFGPGNHTMVQDAAIIWWSNSDRSPRDPATGTYCYTAHGTRHSLGRWPQDPPRIFQQPCF